MQLGLEEYISFEVKNVKKIKGHFGFIVVLNYNDDSTKTQQHAGFLTKEEANREREITIGHLHERKYLVYGTVLFKDYIRQLMDYFIII